MPREEDAMRGKDAHMQATKREESSNIPPDFVTQKIRIL